MDIRKMVFDLVGCDFSGPVEETQAEGLVIQFDGTRAVIGANTLPARARGYFLLAKAIQEGKSSLTLTQKPHFNMVGPMLDVSRGGVMKPASVKKYIDYIRKMRSDR